MTRDPVLDRAEAPPRKAPAPLVALAAALPVILGTMCCVGAPFQIAGGLSSVDQVMAEGGWGVYAVALATPICAAIAAVLVGLAATGRRVPSFLALLFGALPWLLGVVAMRLSMAVAEAAIANADASSQAAMLAAGISESSVVDSYGAAASAGLLAGVGLGLAVAAIAQRAEGRSMMGALAVLLAVPAVGLTGFAVASSPAAGALGVAIALLALIVAGVGGAAMGKDAPRFRSGALGVGGAAAMVLALAASATVAALLVEREVFGALAFAAVDDRAGLVLSAAQEIAPMRFLGTLAPASLVVAVLGLAGLAAVRSRITVGAVAGGVAILVVMGLVVGADRYARGAVATTLEGALAPTWASIDGFTPVELAQGSHGYRTGASVHATTAGVTVGGRTVPYSDPAAIADALRPLVPVPPPSGSFGPDQEVEPVLVLVDARVPAASLRSLADGAVRAGALTLAIEGRVGHTMSEQDRARVADVLPALSLVGMDVAGSVEVGLPGPTATALAEGDEVLYHGAIAPGARSLALTTRPGASPPPLTLGGPVEETHGEGALLGWHVHLLVAPDATAADVALAASWIAAADGRVVIHFDAIPGWPEQAFAAAAMVGVLGALGQGGGEGGSLEDALENVLGSGSLGLTGGLGDGTGVRTERTDVEVQQGSADVRGALSREVVVRVIRRHVNEIRSCYEQGLTRQPSLEGTVTVRFVIGPDGSVQTSEVARSTMNDAAVDRCVATCVQRWTFPAPEGGGVVVINYPFTLRPG